MNSLPPHPPLAENARARGKRRFDVTVWGATGFTGRLVAEYIARRYGVNGGLVWAIAGRSRDKLAEVVATLKRIAPDAPDVPTLLADSHDRGALDAIAGEARVVASTVGPFADHGHDLVAACVDAGTDYCDITGETPFIRDVIDRVHERARQTGARIVHACGYDAIPSDLGTLLVQSAMQQRHGRPAAVVKYFAGKSRGGISGGTVASLLGVIDKSASDERIRRLLDDPYALDPEGGARGPDGADQRGLRWDADLAAWTGPFPMAAVNTRIVRRTNALLGYAYGRDFRYSEAASFGSGAAGWIRAAAAATAMAAADRILHVPTIGHALASALLPAPGQGPSARVRARGYFVSRLVGLELAERSPARVFATVGGTSDPGYGETAKMLAESAVCLALDREGVAHEGGVLTPASCMGLRLVERLRAAGMTFEIDDASPRGTAR